jgi:hypothetical protein
LVHKILRCNNLKEKRLKKKKEKELSFWWAVGGGGQSGLAERRARAGAPAQLRPKAGDSAGARGGRRLHGAHTPERVEGGKRRQWPTAG